ncbi:MAG: hypothetical protein EBZ74_10815 [Planctomycetia bacterium]|nr:hypothetical protein [Planctomycetia bacterium]
MLGCGGSDGRTQVSGTVLWKGKPVPLGSITLEPDASRGGRGPQARIMINRGRYASRAGFGAVHGPVVVEVDGYGVPDRSEFPVQLFPPFRFTTEIPAAPRHQLDIVVPDEKPASRSR